MSTFVVSRFTAPPLGAGGGPRPLIVALPIVLLIVSLLFLLLTNLHPEHAQKLPPV